MIYPRRLNSSTGWRYGTVIRSWLLDFKAEAFKENAELPGIQGFVQDSGAAGDLNPSQR